MGRLPICLCRKNAVEVIGSTAHLLDSGALSNIFPTSRMTYFPRRLMPWLAIVVMLVPVSAAALEALQLARFQGAGDAGVAYQTQLLREALALTPDYRNLPVTLSDLPMSPQRMFSEIAQAQGQANIALWACDSSFMNEPGVKRIDVPVDRGILSFWLLLTREELLPKFAAIKSLPQLRQMKLTFGYPLGKHLRPAWREHLDVYDAPDMMQALRMLQHGRFDAILTNPTFIPKINASLPADGPKLVWEPRLLLEHASATCFAIGEHNHRLELQLQQGLQAVIRSGGAKRISDATQQMHVPAGVELTTRRRLELPASPAMRSIIAPYREWMYQP